MKSNNNQKGALNKRGKGKFKDLDVKTPFQVFIGLVELGEGHKAGKFIEQGGVEGVIKNLLPKVEFNSEQKKYFDLCFTEGMPESEGAESMGMSPAGFEKVKGEVTQALLEAHKDFSRENRIKEKQGKENVDAWDSTHVHYVDFLKVEDSVNAEALTEFERKVREKIACVPSPYDYLIRPELDEEEENRMKSIWKKLALFVSEARFTRMQKRAYDLLYVEKVSDEKAARRLRLTMRQLIYQKKLILKKLIKARKRLEKKKVLRKSLNQVRDRKLSARQRKIFKLWSVDKLSVRQIAERLNISRSVCHRVLKDLKKGGLEKSFV